MDPTPPPIEAWNIRFEETPEWNFPGHLAPHVAKVWTVFLFDRNQQTHYCEITPSYWLMPLYTYAEFVGDPEDRVKDEIGEIILSNQDYEGGYCHCHTIDPLIKQGDRTRVLYRGRLDLAEDDDREEEFERIREQHSCNWTL